MAAKRIGENQLYTSIARTVNRVVIVKHSSAPLLFVREVYKCVLWSRKKQKEGKIILMILTNDATKYFHIDRRTVVIFGIRLWSPFFSSLVFLRTLPVRFSGLQRYILIKDGGKGRENKIDHFSLWPVDKRHFESLHDDSMLLLRQKRRPLYHPSLQIFE